MIGILVNEVDLRLHLLHGCVLTLVLPRLGLLMIRQEPIANRNTISKTYDHRFKDIFNDIFNAEYKDKFAAAGIEYSYRQSC